jgi:hypothetical protein
MCEEGGQWAGRAVRGSGGADAKGHPAAAKASCAFGAPIGKLSRAPGFLHAEREEYVRSLRKKCLPLGERPGCVALHLEGLPAIAVFAATRPCWFARAKRRRQFSSFFGSSSMQFARQRLRSLTEIRQDA